MDPVEINAGNWYLRQVRAGEHIDDRPALIAAHADHDINRFIGTQVSGLDSASELVAHCAQGWASDQEYTWAIAEPTTGDLVGWVSLTNVVLAHHRAEVGVWTLPHHRRRGIALEALGSVMRFGFGALDLHHIGYRHVADNHASAALADRLGFTIDGVMREVMWIEDAPYDAVYLSKLANE